MAERIFVTGATGRIGRPLCATLVAAGHSVAGLSRDDEGEAALRALGVDTIRGDLSDTEALRRGIEGADRLIHLAGGVRGRQGESAAELNTEGTRQVLEVARTSPALKAFVLASTCAVYGDRSWLWVEEDFRPSPNTEYGASKVKAEQLVLDASAEGLPGVIARIAAVYGPEFPFTMAERMQRGVAWLPGEGGNCIPLVHVDDCVNALILLAEKGQAGEIYHVADRSSPALRDFYKEVHGHVGGEMVNFWSTWIPSAVQFYLARKNDDIKTRLGRKPRFTPDNLRLFTNSVRLKTDRLEHELGFRWRYPDFVEGVRASFGG